MAENDGVIIPFIADTSKIDAQLITTIEKLTQTGEVSQEVAAQYKASMAQAAAATQNTTAEVNNLGTSFQQMSKNIAGGAVKEAVETINQFGTSTARVTTQVRAMTNELTKMRLAGEEGSDAFYKLQTATAKLQRESIIARGSVRSLAEEFGTFKAAAESVHLLNASMQVGVGVVSMFGTENEKVEKEIRSLMGVMLIANGIQEAANILQEKSQFRLKLTAAWTGVATQAQWLFAEASTAAWTGALLGIGLVIAALGGLIYAYETLIGKNNALVKAQERLIEFSKKELDIAKERADLAKSQSDDLVSQAEINVKNLEAQKASTDKLRKAEEELSQARVDASVKQLDSLGASVKKYQDAPEKAAAAQKKMIDLIDQMEKKKKEIEDKSFNPFGTGGIDKSLKIQKEALETLKTQIETIKKALSDYNKAWNDQQDQRFEHQRQIDAEELRIVTDKFKLKIALAQSESEQELKFKKSEIQAEAAEKINAIKNEIGNEEDKNLRISLVNAEARKKTIELNRTYAVNNLQNAKANYDAENLLAIKGTEEELNIQIESLIQQSAIDEAKIKEGKNASDERIRIEKELYAKIRALRKDFNEHQSQEIYQAGIITAQANAEVQAKNTREELIAKKDVIKAEYNLAIHAANQIMDNEQLKSAAVLKANSDLIEKLKAADNKYAESQIANNKEHTGLLIGLAQASQQATDSDPLASDKEKRDAQKATLRAEHDGLVQQIGDNEKQYKIDVKNAGDNTKEKERIGIDYELKQKIVAKNITTNNNKQQAIDIKDVQENAKKVVDVAKEISDNVFKIENEARDKKYELELERIQKTSDFELNNDRLTYAQKAAIKKKFDKEAAAIKLQQWNADKQAREEQAVINTALAVVNALATAPTIIAGVALAAGAAAAGAAEIATIAATKPPAFALGTPKGTPDTPYGMKLVGEKGPELIYSKGGERIVPNKQTAKILSDYAIPSIPYMNAAEFGDVTTNSNLAIDYNKLGKSVAEALKANPQTKISLDKNGYTTFIVQKASRFQFNNNKFKA